MTQPKKSILNLNEPQLTLHDEAIAKDFDWIVIQTSGKESQDFIELDRLEYESFGVQSLLYTKRWKHLPGTDVRDGTCRFLLLDKKKKGMGKLREMLQASGAFPDSRLIRLDVSLCRTPGETGRYLRWILTQLIWQLIAGNRYDEGDVPNLYGGLWYPAMGWRPSEEEDCLCFVRIDYSQNGQLNLGVQTLWHYQKEVEEEAEKKGGEKAKKIRKSWRWFIRIPLKGRLKRIAAIDRDQWAKTDGVEVYHTGTFRAFRHHTKDYFLFETMKAHETDKVSLLQAFVKDIQRHLGRYLTLESITTEKTMTCHATKKSQSDGSRLIQLKKRIREQFQTGPGLHIFIDTDFDTESVEKIAWKLQEAVLKEVPGISIDDIDKTPHKGKYNICLLHDKEYYLRKRSQQKEKTKDKIKDEYQRYDSLTQHVTVDGWLHTKSEKRLETKIAAEIPTILKELLIKEDMKRRHITMYPGLDSLLEKPMIFVKRIKNKEKSTDICPVYTYYGVRIEKDQTMGFFTFRDDLWESWTGDFKEPVTREGWRESERIQADYEKAERQRWENAPEDLTDCLMSWEGGMYFPVYRTAQTILPDIGNIEDTLHRLDLRWKRWIPRSVIHDSLTAFVSSAPSGKEENYKAYAKEIKTQLENVPDAFQDHPEDYDYAWLSDILKVRSAKAKARQEGNKEEEKRLGAIAHTGTHCYAGFLWNWSKKYKEEAIQLSKDFNKQAQLPYYGLEGMQGIWYYQEDGAFYYFVAHGRIADAQYALPRAFRIRKIPDTLGLLSKDKGALMKQYLTLLETAFVRSTGEYTVVPFPLKYLNEYIKDCVRKEKEAKA